MSKLLVPLLACAKGHDICPWFGGVSEKTVTKGQLLGKVTVWHSCGAGQRGTSEGKRARLGSSRGSGKMPCGQREEEVK